jgi:hypothetical protein
MKHCICHVIKYAIGTVLLVGFLFNSASAVVTYEPRISVGNMYIDNLHLTADDEEHDFITTLRPEINLNMSDRFSSLSLFYSPTYASYLRFPENNTLRHNASIDGSRQITRTTSLEFSNNYLYTEDPLSDADEIDSDTDTTIRQGREPYSANTTALSVSNQFGPEDSIALEYEYYFLKNTDLRLEDNNHHRPSIIMNYWLVPNRYGTESEISYIKRNFDESEDYNDVLGRLRLTRRLGPHFEIYAEYTQELTDYVSEGEDYKVYSPLVGFTWDEYINYSLSASFGYFFRENDHSGSDSGPLGTINSRYTWEQGTSVSISGVAGFDRASGGAENLGFNPYYDVTGIVDYPMSQRLHTNLFAGYHWNIYTDENPDRDDTIWRTGVGLTYQTFPWMVVGMNYMFRKLNSNINTEDYVENRAEFTVTLAPRQPVMLSD